MRKLTTSALLLTSAVVLGGCAQEVEREGVGHSVQEVALSGTSSGIDASLSVTSDWGTGYCTNVTVQNVASQSQSWSVTIDLGDSTIQNIWGGVPSVNGPALTVTPLEWNEILAPNQTTQFGFCANGSSASGGSGGSAGAGGAGGGAGGAGGTPTGGTTPQTNDLVETDILSRWTSGSTTAPVETELTVLTGSQAYSGQAALRAVTDAPFDFFLRYASPEPIDVGDNDSIRVASSALNASPYGWQIAAPVIIIEDTTGAQLTLEPSSNHLPTDGSSWVELVAPLAGGFGWTRTGDADLQHVHAIELHTDTWDAGFRWDIDAVQFVRRFESCEGTPATLTASAAARASTATVTFTPVAGAVGYDIYRAEASGTPAFVARSRGTTFEDSGLALGTTYEYEVHPVLAEGCESGAAVTSVTTLASASGLARVPTLKVLVPLYVGITNPYTATEIAKMKAGVELARQFYYRNTNARLNLALDFMEIAADAPSTTGPSLQLVEADLRVRGIFDEQYDAVYVIANNLSGCWGGFQLLGRSVGAFGTICGVPYPSNDSNVNTTLSWVFTHEFQHALDRLVDVSGNGDLIGGHPDSVYGDAAYSGPIIDAGEHYDWEAATLRAFGGYETFNEPFHGYLEVEDPDGDLLASVDARLPTDEQRFGSSPTSVDTDGDGLDDLAEYTVGRFTSSNPVVADTDGDGQLDGVDPTPQAAIAASMVAFTPTIDGVRDAGYTLFRNGVEFTNAAGFTAATYIAYDADYVYLLAEESQPATMAIVIDGSGPNGFWHGDDSYAFTLTPGAAQPLNHTSRHSTEEPGVAPADSLLVTATVDGITTVEARIPSANLGQGFGFTGSDTTGFSTALGSVLGFRITFTQFGGLGDLFSPPWATQNEYYHFDDVTLL